ncbi:MAG: hypothetical protein J6U20_10370 [Fibrobacter sp.]|nr:hypothetical protein [Fibrobacter sp.]
MKNLKVLVASIVLTAASVAFAGQEISGNHLLLKDTTVGVSGLWNWITVSDTFNIGTEIVPARGTSPLFAKDDGSIFAEAYMEIGPEPMWTPQAADSGLLKYPQAHIEMKFKKDECVQDSSCGVNLSALGIKYVRITSKVSGPIRMSVLNELTAEEGAEPGVNLQNSSDYQTTIYDLTPFDYGFKGFDDNNFGGLFNWVDLNKAPEGSRIIKQVTGLKWELRDKDGATGEISIKSIEFLDAQQKVVETSLLTGVTGVRSNINDPLPSSIASGEQQELKDTTVGVSGLWNWITYSDTLGIGTEIVPPPGTSPLFAKEDGSIFAEASMKIGPEPMWTQQAADSGLLKYPQAYIEVKFKKDECVQDSSCAVNFTELGIQYIRIKTKVSGPIRMSVLNEKTAEKDAEPGTIIPNSAYYKTTTYDLTPKDYGFVGFDDHNYGGVPNWANHSKAPEGSKILTAVTGLRWEVKDKVGAIGEISIKSIEFLDAHGNNVKASLLTGIVETRSNTNDPLYTVIASGERQALHDTTVGVSGLWNWIASHDFLDIGTVMIPDSGASPLVAKGDGSIFAEASMKIGPEPMWTQQAADSGLLKYPFAYIEMKFKKDECVQDGSCGVNLSALGVKYVRVTSKTSGRIRMSVLNEKTAEEGTEPGVYIQNSYGYQATTYDLTPYEYGFAGFDDHNHGGVFDWVNLNEAPEGSEIIKHVTGFRWELKAKEGGIGEISIKSIEFIDMYGNVIDAFNITGMEGVRSVIKSSSSAVVPESSSSSVEPVVSSFSVVPESSSSSVEPVVSSSSVEPESSSSSVEPVVYSSSVKPESSSSKTTKSSSSVAPKSSSSKKATSSSSVAPKSSSSKKSKSSSSVTPKSSSSKKSKSSSSAAPKSSSSSNKSKNALPLKHIASMTHITVSGKQILISNAIPGSDYAVFTMQGKVITAGKIQNRVENITLQNQGAFLVRVGHEIFKVK